MMGTLDTAEGDDHLGRFKADFWPNDLGDHFAIDTNIVLPDGGRFEGAFVFAEGIVGRGNATFSRVR